MATYRRVAYEDRCHISALLQAKVTVSEISKALGFHKSSIHREISRNKHHGGYTASLASKKTQKRYRRCRRRKKITEQLHFV